MKINGKVTAYSANTSDPVGARLTTDGTHGVKPILSFDSGLSGVNYADKAQILGGYNSPTSGVGGYMSLRTKDISEVIQDRLTIDAAGLITLPYGQIAFPATQNASSNANTLDDYEEGTWTPTGAGSSGGTPTYLSQVGEYTKIGHLVICRSYLRLNGLGTMSGNFLLGGLPFAVSTTAYVSVNFPYFSGTNINVSGLGGYIGNAATAINVTKVTGTGGTGSLALAVSELQTGIEFMMQLSYKV